MLWWITGQDAGSLMFVNLWQPIVRLPMTWSRLIRVVVPPEWIEHSTPPFAPLPLSRPPSAPVAAHPAFGGPDHPLTLEGPRPSGLYTFSRRRELGSGLAWAFRPAAFPEFERFSPGDRSPGRQFLPRVCSTTELRRQWRRAPRPAAIPEPNMARAPASCGRDIALPQALRPSCRVQIDSPRGEEW